LGNIVLAVSTVGAYLCVLSWSQNMLCCVVKYYERLYPQLLIES